MACVHGGTRFFHVDLRRCSGKITPTPGNLLDEVIYMTDLRKNPFDGTRDVVITLRDRAIEASIAELKRQDELTVALRSALKNGVDVNELSEASGLTVKEIRMRVERELNIGEDMASLSGIL